MRPLPNLDFLRACAVTSVVADHVLLAYKIQRIGPWTVEWIGIVGVLLFFVHTSLVLMWSLERKPHTLDFYIRRVFRIYPLTTVLFAVVLIFHAPVNGTPNNYFQYHLVGGLKSALAALLLIPNLFGPGYLPEGVLWTLQYEVEMYLLLPVIFFFIKKNLSLWPLLTFWVFTILVCHHPFKGIPHNFFLCVPFFLPGLMAYVGFRRYRSRLPAWTFAIFLCALWACFLSRPGWRVADVLCLVAGLALPWFHQITNRGLIRATHEIAKYSYGIYLAHPLCIVLGVYLEPHMPLAWQLAVIFTSLVIMSVAAYHFIEKPLIDLGKRVAKFAERRYEMHELQLSQIPPSEIR